MIAKLSGRLDATGEDWAIVDVAGVGYLVHCSRRTLAALGEVGEACTVHTELQVSENDMRLLGFAEGAERDWAITSKSLVGKNGKVEKLVAARVEWIKDETTGQMRMQEIKGSEFDIQADLVLLAMGFVAPVSNVLTAFGIDQDPRGNARANTDDYKSNVDKVFAAGDMRRGQSLVVWAIREGRQCARSVDEFLMGSSELPR